MKVEKKDFGKYIDCKINLYTIRNVNNVEISIMEYGATITSFRIPTDNGVDDIVCGFNSFEEYFSEEYVNNAPYFGATVGRYCSKIKNAQFILDNEVCLLSKNAGDDSLHGGLEGFDKKRWKGEVVSVDGKIKGVEFLLTSKNGDSGFPGNITAKVMFSLTDDNELVINYYAETDRKTPFTMTNHSYFNLSGFKKSIEDHRVSILSNSIIPLNIEGNINDCMKNISNTAQDLNELKLIMDVHQEMNDGFEHYYYFGGKSKIPRKVALISDVETKRELEVFTTEPGMLFYTGKYTSNKLQRETGEQYGKYRAFCCETHRCPNGPNISEINDVYITPEEPYIETTIFKLKQN